MEKGFKGEKNNNLFIERYGSGIYELGKRNLTQMKQKIHIVQTQAKQRIKIHPQSTLETP